MKHKVTEATQVTFQCVTILILSDSREEKYVFGPHHKPQCCASVSHAADFIVTRSSPLTARTSCYFSDPVLCHISCDLYFTSVSHVSKCISAAKTC